MEESSEKSLATHTGIQIPTQQTILWIFNQKLDFSEPHLTQLLRWEI